MLESLRKYGSGRRGNEYGKVCYTNMLTQAQVLYTNFDFPTFAGENHKVLVNLTSPKSENSSDLGFSFLPSFEKGEIRGLSDPHLFGSTPQCPPRAPGANLHVDIDM